MSTIPDYPHAAPLDGSELVPLFQQGRQVQAAASEFAAPIAAQAAVDLAGVVAGAGAALDVKVQAAEAARAGAVAAANISKPVTAPAMPVSTSDSAGRVPEYLDPSGKKHTAYSQVGVLNGVRPEALMLGQKQKRANFLSSAAFCGVVGQSLAYTTFAGANISTTRRGRAMVAPFEVANPSPDSFVPATTIAQPDTGETPMFALVNETYALLERENGLADDRHGFTMVSGNNAFGGTDIPANSKGQPRYQRNLAQLAALRQWGLNTGTPVVSFGNFAMAGEVEQAINLDHATVKQRVLNWARDYAADHRAILTGADDVSRGQTFDPILLIDTTCSYVAGSNVRATPRAVLAACIDYFEGVIPPGHTKPAPAVHTGATYYLGVPSDPTGVHCNAEGSHTKGCEGALAIKRIFLDEIDPSIPQHKRWPPMYFLLGAGQTRRVGTNTLILKVQMRAPHAALVPFGKAVAPYPNGSGIAEQEDYGFGMWDGTALRMILAPKVVAPDEIAITVASGNLPTALRIGAGLDHAARRMLLHTGAATNCRDDYGDLVQSSLGVPLHNHLSPQAILMDSAGVFTRF